VAPHPFYPIASSLRDRMDRHAELFDAVECNAMFTASLNFNRKGESWARAHGRPMVGNGDIHRLGQLDTAFSLVDAAAHPDAICAAIRAGRVEVVARPLSWAAAVTIMGQLVIGDIRKGRPGPHFARSV
jgi:predicted metal-dependent phosphoesterase TrpH